MNYDFGKIGEIIFNNFVGIQFFKIDVLNF